MEELYLVYDCEATNLPKDEKGQLDISSSQVYDLGGMVVNKEGKVYEEISMVNRDVFYDKNLMDVAYFKDKIPQYEKEIREGKRKVVNTWKMMREFYKTIKKYNITTVIAHNARFDVASLNATLRYQTKSKKRFFFPYGIKIWDSMKMASATICKDEDYKKFCADNGYMTSGTYPRVRRTAEILWRFLSGNNSFEEDHTGLEDVKIESKIFSECIKRGVTEEQSELFKRREEAAA